MMNRRISMGMMLELARKQPHRQFIFLSPQDMRLVCSLHSTCVTSSAPMQYCDQRWWLHENHQDGWSRQDSNYTRLVAWSLKTVLITNFLISFTIRKPYCIYNYHITMIVQWNLSILVNFSWPVGYIRQVIFGIVVVASLDWWPHYRGTLLDRFHCKPILRMFIGSDPVQYGTILVCWYLKSKK